MNEVHVSAYTLTSALAVGMAGTRAALDDNRGGLRATAWPGAEVKTCLGAVELPIATQFDEAWESRNNRLINLALSQDQFTDKVRAVKSRFGAERCGVVMGTSTSSIDRTEQGYRQLQQNDRFPPEFRQSRMHNPHTPGAYVAELLGIDGPCMTISAACASSAKVFASAARWLQMQLVDAVIVGGADSLCMSVIYGFHSLQLIAENLCCPFDVERQGINLGEAAGFAILTRDAMMSELAMETDIRLLGAGESCDAYHMSSAHPEGLGAELSMQRALTSANLTFADIDYVNLHGTGTRANDATESLVCERLLDERTLASATKGWTGHALGAAGIVESVLCFDALATGRLPGTLNTRTPEVNFNLLLENRYAPIRTALTNSFGFGGNNCTLVFGLT